MRPKSIILLVLALGCGLVASVGINQVMANRAAQSGAQAGETTPIFVALGEIGLGDPLTPEVLKLEEWPKGKVPPGALDKLEDIEGRRTKTRFYPGEPIIDAKLFGKGDNGGAATDLIPKGFRVVSVKVDSVSGSGLILPGDRVDVLVHLDDQHGRNQGMTATRTFLQNVKVFAVNDVFARDGGEEQAIAAKTISLLVTPQQAELVTLANEMGKIRLVMRSANDDAKEETTGVTTAELFNKRGPGTAYDAPASAAMANAPQAADLLKLLQQKIPSPAAAPAEPAPPTPSKAWKMLLIEGSGVREVEFADGSLIGTSTQLQEPSSGSSGTVTPPEPLPISTPAPADPPSNDTQPAPVSDDAPAASNQSTLRLR